MTDKKELELHDIEAINSVAKSFDKPKTVQMSQDVYNEFQRGFFPIERHPTLTKDEELAEVCTDNGDLDIEIIPGKNLMRVTGKSKYELVEDNDDRLDE